MSAEKLDTKSIWIILNRDIMLCLAFFFLEIERYTSLSYINSIKLVKREFRQICWDVVFATHCDMYYQDHFVCRIHNSIYDAIRFRLVSR